MGVDINILVRPTEPFSRMDEPVIVALREDIKSAFPDLDFDLWGTDLDMQGYTSEFVSITVGYRYFGPSDYGRGFWPQIRKILVWALDRYETYVGPDTTECTTRLTAAYIRECDLLWNAERAPENGKFVPVMNL